MGVQGFLDGRRQSTVVGDDLEASGLDDLRRVAFAREDTLEGLARQLVVDASRVDKTLELRDLSGADPGLVEGDFTLLGAARDLTHPPLAGGGGIAASGNRGLDEFEGTGVDDVAHLHVRVPPFGAQAAALGDREFRQRGSQFLNPCAIRADRHQVGFGEVAVVLGIRLFTAGRRGAVLLVVVAGLLQDRATVGQDLGLALHLVAHGRRDTAERVHVLRLGARTKR